MRTRKETLYKEIQAALEVYEWHRLEAAKKKNVLQIAVGVLGIIMLLILVISGKFIDPFYILPAFGFFLFLAKLTMRSSNKFDSIFMKDLIQSLFIRKEVEMNLLANKAVKSRYFNLSKLFPSSDLVYGTNLIKGKTNKVSFEASNLKASNVKIDGTIEINYQGFFWYSYINKTTGHKLTIATKDFKNTEPYFTNRNKIDYGTFGGIFTTELISSGSSKLLTDQFKQKMIEFRIKHDIPFVIRIVNDRIYLAMAKRKLKFETTLEYNVDNQRNIDKIEEECELIFDLIDLVENLENLTKGQ